MLPNINIFIYLIPFLALFGESIRLPINLLNGLTLIDIFVSITIAFYATHSIFTKTHFQIKSLKILKPTSLFILTAALSLTLSLFTLSLQQALPGALYLIRFAEYFGLYFICSQNILSQKQIQTFINSNIIAGLILSLFGFIQLKLLPSLEQLEKFGYDPHINRLVSTWLDPNLLAGYLSFIFVLSFSQIYYSKNKFTKLINIIISVILITTIFLTYSRSGYLCLAFAFITFALIKSRKLLIALLISFTLLLFISDRALNRVIDLKESAISFIAGSTKPLDPTAKLRIQSWQQGLNIFSQNPILGVGYNNLRQVKLNKGYISDQDNHAGAGSDSSIITILATTGILGTFFYLLTIMQALILSYKKITDPIKSSLALATFSGLTGLLVHSIFVNSLLFAPIMALTFCCLGVLDSNPKATS